MPVVAKATSIVAAGFLIVAVDGVAADMVAADMFAADTIAADIPVAGTAAADAVAVDVVARRRAPLNPSSEECRQGRTHNRAGARGRSC